MGKKEHVMLTSSRVEVTDKLQGTKVGVRLGEIHPKEGVIFVEAGVL